MLAIMKETNAPARPAMPPDLLALNVRQREDKRRRSGRMEISFTPDPSLYPFESKWFDSSAGRVHYIAEGSGTPILPCHGNPTWIGVVSPSLLSVHRCRSGRASDRAPQTPRPRRGCRISPRPRRVVVKFSNPAASASPSLTTTSRHSKAVAVTSALRLEISPTSRTYATASVRSERQVLIPFLRFAA